MTVAVQYLEDQRGSSCMYAYTACTISIFILHVVYHTTIVNYFVCCHMLLHRVQKWELLWIVGTLLVRSVCIFDWSLYTCAHKEWEYQNVNAANHKNTKYTLNIFIQKTEKQKSDKRKEKRRHWHRSSFGGFWRSAFYLSLPHPFSLYLSVCACVCLSATSTNVDNQIKDFRNRAENRNRSRNGDCTEVPWNHHNFQP